MRSHLNPMEGTDYLEVQSVLFNQWVTLKHKAVTKKLLASKFKSFIQQL